jgi:hypothetical protein
VDHLLRDASFILILYSQHVNMPPIRDKNSTNSIEQEGPILFAISALKNGEICSILEAARIFQVPYTTLHRRYLVSK